MRTTSSSHGQVLHCICTRTQIRCQPLPQVQLKKNPGSYSRSTHSLSSEPILLCFFDNFFFFLQLVYCIIISPSFLSHFHQHANIPPFNKCSLDLTPPWIPLCPHFLSFFFNIYFIYFWQCGVLLAALGIFHCRACSGLLWLWELQSTQAQ